MRKLRAFATVASASELQRAAARRKNVRATEVVVMVVLVRGAPQKDSFIDFYIILKSNYISTLNV